MQVTKAWLLSVLNLIGSETVMISPDQTKDEVKQHQSNPRWYMTLNLKLLNDMLLPIKIWVCEEKQGPN